MGKIFAILITALILPAAGWAVCCTSISSGPTAHAPQYSQKGCGTASKASYGGDVNVQCDASALYMTTVTTTAKLIQLVPGLPDVVVAATGPTGSDVRCNANTGLSTWTTTPTCAILKGKSNITRFIVKTTACPASPARTVSVDSPASVSP